MAVSVFGDTVILSQLKAPQLSHVLDTNSMVPTFDAGDLLILEEPHNLRVEGIVVWQRNNLRVGDIVVWQRKAGEPLSCHRIIKMKYHLVQTKGDHNWFADKWIKDTEIKYRVKGILYREG